jgi:predicted ABC-type sugar transport system permease subunit
MKTAALARQAEPFASRLLAGRGDLIVNNILLVALILLIAFFASRSPVFLSVSNFKVILTNYAAIGVVAAVMTLLVIAGHVDLSVGSNIAFSGMVTALAITSWGVPPAAAFGVGVATGGGGRAGQRHVERGAPLQPDHRDAWHAGAAAGRDAAGQFDRGLRAGRHLLLDRQR